MFLLSNWFSKKQVTEKATASLDGWREIARTTVMVRNALGFHSDSCIEEMALAGYTVIQSGGSINEAIDAVESAYNRNFFYSTPHEHPCDEWPVHAIKMAA